MEKILGIKEEVIAVLKRKVNDPLILRFQMNLGVTYIIDYDK